METAKNFDWIPDPIWRERVSRAWEAYDGGHEIHLLYQYLHLVDEASVALRIIAPSELDSGLGDDQAPSLTDVW